MALKLSLLSILLTTNLFLFVSCWNPEAVPDECLDSFDPNGDSELTEFLQHNSQICSEDTTESNTSVVNSFKIRSYVKSRFVTTYVAKSMTNRLKTDQNVEFLTYIPTAAYITSFIVEIDGKLYKSNVSKRILEPTKHENKTKEQAIDLRKVKLTTTLKPNSTIVYHLLYEELLQREDSRYEVNLGINPGQIIRNLDVEVLINDYKPIQNVGIPVLMSPYDEVEKKDERLKPIVKIDYKNPNSVLIRFHPTVEQQNKYIQALGTQANNGLEAQFRVHYDVKRSQNGGELITHGSYFVHYFAPQRLNPEPKHVLFVLDVSEGMGGKRMNLLKEAMKTIFRQLKPQDVFNIIRFQTTVSVADINNRQPFKEIIHDKFVGNYAQLDKILNKTPIPEAAKANKPNINKAITIVNSLQSGGSSNIIGGLQLALLMVKRTQKLHNNKYEPIIMFVTDSEPNGGAPEEHKIISTVTTFNNNSASIFSIGIGDGTNLDFLKRLSALNKGVSLSIKQDADISSLLEQFFEKYSTPVLRDIRFDYNTAIIATKRHFPTYFDGTELVVAGKFESPICSPHITAKTQNGTVEFETDVTQSSTSLERLWAYLRIHQNVDTLENHGLPNPLQLNHTIKLALKYSYVTQLTAMKLTLPPLKIINDSSILTPPYKLTIDLSKVPVIIKENEIQPRVLPVEVEKAPQSEIVEKLSTAIKNVFFKILWTFK